VPSSPWRLPFPRNKLISAPMFRSHASSWVETSPARKPWQRLATGSAPTLPICESGREDARVIQFGECANTASIRPSSLSSSS